MGKAGCAATCSGQPAWHLLQLTQRAAEPLPRLWRFCRCRAGHRTAGSSEAKHMTLQKCAHVGSLHGLLQRLDHLLLMCNIFHCLGPAALQLSLSVPLR